MADRIIEKIDIEPCGCYVQRITDTWMGETIVYDNPVICSEHW
jgi:hypothetical protein